MRPHGSAEQLEQRRRQAVAMGRQGYGPTEIARLLNTTPQTVCQWMRRYRRGGPKALAASPMPGRPPKLNARRRQALVSCLLKGASTFGFATDLWTCPRIGQLIQQRYGVQYHVDAIPRLMASLDFSPSEARTASGRTRRRGYRPVDSAGVAAHQTPGPAATGPRGFHR
jgi:transposase